jgi:hypothetical protein
MSAPEQLALATAARLAHALDPDGWARLHGDVDWDDQLRRVSLHYDSRGGWRWEYDSDGFWWAESHEGNMVLCEREAAEYEGAGRQRTHDYANVRVAFPGLARLVDARNAQPPTLAAAQAEWAAAGGDPERGPALSGRSEDGRGEWSVKVSGGGDTGLRAMIVVRIRVGSAAYVRFGNETWVPEGRAPLADWRECVRLAEAADGGAK